MKRRLSVVVLTLIAGGWCFGQSGRVMTPASPAADSRRSIPAIMTAQPRWRGTPSRFSKATTRSSSRPAPAPARFAPIIPICSPRAPTGADAPTRWRRRPSSFSLISPMSAAGAPSASRWRRPRPITTAARACANWASRRSRGGCSRQWRGSSLPRWKARRPAAASAARSASSTRRSRTPSSPKRPRTSPRPGRTCCWAAISAA